MWNRNINLTNIYSSVYNLGNISGGYNVVGGRKHFILVAKFRLNVSGNETVCVLTFISTTSKTKRKGKKQTNDKTSCLFQFLFGSRGCILFKLKFCGVSKTFRQYGFIFVGLHKQFSTQLETDEHLKWIEWSANLAYLMKTFQKYSLLSSAAAMYGSRECQPKPP